MKNQRIFFAFFCIAYALLSATGIFLFGRPGYSKEYLANDHEDHKRYLAISKNPLYQKYCERPLLNPLDQHLQKEADFAAAYTARPAFRAERMRMFLYAIWFKVLNALFLFILFVRFGLPIARTFLDSHIHQIQTKKDTLEDELARASSQAAESREAFSHLPNQEAALEQSFDDLYKKKLADIEKQSQHALEQLAIDTEKRIAAEEQAAAAAVRRELVDNALHELERKYRKEPSQEHLIKSVEQFCQYMEIIS